MEPKGKRRNILVGFGLLGFLTSVNTAWFLYESHPTAHIIGQCMGYSLVGIERNLPANFDFFAYFTPVVISFFVSRYRHVKITGALIMIGLVISHAINKEASTSVWCFFAALASLHIAWSFYELKQPQRIKLPRTV